MSRSQSFWTFGEVDHRSDALELDEWIVEHMPTLAPGDMHIEMRSRRTGRRATYLCPLEELADPIPWYTYRTPDAAIDAYLRRQHKDLEAAMRRINEIQDRMAAAEAFRIEFHSKENS
jgi:hypothetical protein